MIIHFFHSVTLNSLTETRVSFSLLFLFHMNYHRRKLNEKTLNVFFFLSLFYYGVLNFYSYMRLLTRTRDENNEIFLRFISFHHFCFKRTRHMKNQFRRFLSVFFFKIQVHAKKKMKIIMRAIYVFWSVSFRMYMIRNIINKKKNCLFFPESIT